MRSTVRSRCALALAALCMSAAPAAAQTSQSEPLARELSALMAQHKLDAFAAKDPAAPDTYVAAMLFPNVQLLIVDGQPTSPAATQAELDQHQYADVYTTLQQAVVASSKVFFQDLKADGLHAKAPDTVDIVYEHVSNQTIFDGDPGKHRLSQSQYAEKFSAADAKYARLLKILVDELKAVRADQ
jgi:hypothetical protein